MTSMACEKELLQTHCEKMNLENNALKTENNDLKSRLDHLAKANTENKDLKWQLDHLSNALQEERKKRQELSQKKKRPREELLSHQEALENVRQASKRLKVENGRLKQGLETVQDSVKKEARRVLSLQKHENLKLKQDFQEMNQRYTVTFQRLSYQSTVLLDQKKKYQELMSEVKYWKTAAIQKQTRRQPWYLQGKKQQPKTAPIVVDLSSESSSSYDSEI